MGLINDGVKKKCLWEGGRGVTGLIKRQRLDGPSFKKGQAMLFRRSLKKYALLNEGYSLSGTWTNFDDLLTLKFRVY